MAAKDCAIVKERWNAGIDDRLEIARGELVAKHDEIYKIAMSGYFKTKNTRMLEIASKELECLGRLLGQAGPSINLHNHQHNVAVTTDAVAALFQPLDAGAYADMVAAKPLPPSEAQELPDIEAEAEDLGTDDWGSAAAKDPETGSAVENGELVGNPAHQPGASQGRLPLHVEGQNRRIRHPLR